MSKRNPLDRILKALLIMILSALCTPLMAEQNDHSKNPIWLIENQKNKVFLAGSIHVLRKQDYPLPLVFETVYEEAEQIVLELALSQIQQQQATRLTQSLALLPESQSLESLLGIEEYRALNQRARGANIDLRQFSRVEPWYAAISIAQIQMQRLGFESGLGLDNYVSKKASADNKKETGLETLKQQLQYLDLLPLDSQIQLLTDSLDPMATLKAESNDLIKAWQQGDLVALDRLFAVDLDNNPAFKQALLVERNNKWLPQIISYINQADDYLVVTGALHLVGDDGLIQLLRDKGYKIRQL